MIATKWHESVGASMKLKKAEARTKAWALGIDITFPDHRYLETFSIWLVLESQ